MDRCKFRFTLFWDQEHRLWYFDEFGSGNLEHNGHCPLPEKEVKVSTPGMGKAARKSAANLNGLHGSSSTAPALIQERTGVVLTPGEMPHLGLKSSGEEEGDHGIDENASVPALGVDYGGPVEDGEVFALSCRIPHLTIEAREVIQNDVFRNSTPFDALAPVVKELADLCTNPEMFNTLTALLHAGAQELRRRHGTLELGRR
jgi:hypothetical protein